MPVRIEPHSEPIPGYRLIERLGGGGFGEVWKCEAPGGLFKAIKFVYGDMDSVDDGDGSRAEQELKAQTLFLVFNPVKVPDFGLVKDLGTKAAATITGGVTPVYAAPETFDG